MHIVIKPRVAERRVVCHPVPAYKVCSPARLGIFSSNVSLTLCLYAVNCGKWPTWVLRGLLCLDGGVHDNFCSRDGSSEALAGSL